MTSPAGAKRFIIMVTHEPKRFAEKVTYISSPGYLEGGDARRHHGFVGGGPSAIITTLGVLRPEAGTNEFVLDGWFPFSSPDEIRANTGWDLKASPGAQSHRRADARGIGQSAQSRSDGRLAQITISGKTCRMTDAPFLLRDDVLGRRHLDPEPAPIAQWPVARHVAGAQSHARRNRRRRRCARGHYRGRRSSLLRRARPQGVARPKLRSGLCRCAFRSAPKSCCPSCGFQSR